MDTGVVAEVALPRPTFRTRKMADIELKLVDQDAPHTTCTRVVGHYNIGAYCKHSECYEFIALATLPAPPSKTIRVSTDKIGAIIKCPHCLKYSIYRDGDFRQITLNSTNVRRSF